ncbi:MAG TPA: 50S ribosomal protein L23 [Candidatus Pacearchaeota archaeon]|nr:50S ribosomal protein L23 [Candidatus Pacearchaeota archaeon]
MAKEKTEKTTKTEAVKVAKEKKGVAKEKPKPVAKKTAKVETKKETVAQIHEEKAKRVLTINPLVSEKAVMMIESQNIITFEADRNATKHEIQKEIEDLFNVKVDEIRTLNAKNKKHAYVKLNSKFPAIDLATKLGMM